MIEREVKLGAWAGSELRDLNGVVEHVCALPRPPKTLTYPRDIAVVDALAPTVGI